MDILLIVIFLTAYAAVALEHPLKINKTASALLAAGLLWTSSLASSAWAARLLITCRWWLHRSACTIWPISRPTAFSGSSWPIVQEPADRSLSSARRRGCRYGHGEDPLLLVCEKDQRPGPDRLPGRCAGLSGTVSLAARLILLIKLSEAMVNGTLP